VAYHDTLEKLTSQVEGQVVAALERWKAGALTEDQFVQIVAALIAISNGRAIALADLGLAAALSVSLGVAQPATGVGLKPSAQRLEKGTRTLTAAANAGNDITDRLTRFAHAEASNAAAEAWSDGITENKNVTGWVRQLDGDPCQLCVWWWREGQVWPKDHRMPHHKGCKCTPKPVTRGRTK
jgi:hypothetical protein